MTSLVAWVGADSRGVASAYFASDSRITWPASAPWDHGRKLFACRRYPHILGYCGDVLFPTQTLSQITEMIDSDLLVKSSDTVDERTSRIVSTLEAAFETYPATSKQAFEILYCTRESAALLSQFHLRQITFSPSGAPKVSLIEVPMKSETIAILGSGASSVREHLGRWRASDVGGTSRAMFSAFCDSLRSGRDSQRWPSSACRTLANAVRNDIRYRVGRSPLFLRRRGATTGNDEQRTVVQRFIRNLRP